MTSNAAKSSGLNRESYVGVAQADVTDDPKCSTPPRSGEQPSNSKLCLFSRKVVPTCTPGAAAGHTPASSLASHLACLYACQAVSFAGLIALTALLLANNPLLNNDPQCSPTCLRSLKSDNLATLNPRGDSESETWLVDSESIDVDGRKSQLLKFVRTEPGPEYANERDDTATLDKSAEKKSNAEETKDSEELDPNLKYHDFDRHRREIRRHHRTVSGPVLLREGSAPSGRNDSHHGNRDHSSHGRRHRQPSNPRGYVELPTFFRIPDTALIGFCHAADSYCDKRAERTRGPPGMPGRRGKTGKRGKKGDTGAAGICNCTAESVATAAATRGPSPPTSNEPDPSGGKSQPVIEPPRSLEHNGATDQHAYSVVDGNSSNDSNGVTNGVSNFLEEDTGAYDESVADCARRKIQQEAEKRTVQKHSGNVKKRCQMKMGLRKLHANMGIKLGSWMKDVAGPHRGPSTTRRYVTEHATGLVVYEYADAAALRAKRESEKYFLPGNLMYQGTNHIVHNGSFYYHAAKTQKIIRYNLATARYQSIPIPNGSFTGSDYLYAKTQSYMELAVDRFGIWVVYRDVSSPLIRVARIDPTSGSVVKTWTLNIKVGSFENTFIACGILYAIESLTAPQSHINFVYDLRCDKELKAGRNYLRWENFYPPGLPRPKGRGSGAGGASMVAFDDVRKRLLVYEAGGFLSTVGVHMKCRCGRLKKCYED